MNFLIRYKFWKLKMTARPSRRFRVGLWSKLENEWQKDGGGYYSWYQVFAWRVVISVFVGVLVVSGMITTVYAYSSPTVTDGHILYPVKKGLELAEQMTARTPEAKAKFYLKKIKRREAEKVVMQKRQMNLEKVESQIEGDEDQLEQINKMLQTNDLNLKNSVEARLEKRRIRLEQQLHKLETQEQQLKGRASTSTQDNGTNN